MRYGTYDRVKPPKKSERTILVSKNCRDSIINLRNKLDDADYFEHHDLEYTDTYTGRIIETTRIMGYFANDIICNDCFSLGEESYLYRQRCILANAIAISKPFVIKCPKCKTDYMEEIRKLDDPLSTETK
jgi:hypothetical protein